MNLSPTTVNLIGATLSLPGMSAVMRSDLDTPFACFHASALGMPDGKWAQLNRRDFARFVTSLQQAGAAPQQPQPQQPRLVLN